MSEKDISGTTEISDTGIKKHFEKLEPWEALSELIWNGFDAGATEVNVTISNNAIDATETVSILDNGDGIDFSNIKDNFGRFNDSSKKGDISQHGRHGRGRLAFYRICHNANWYTKNEKGCASISINSNNIKKFDGKSGINHDTLPTSLQKNTQGTCVILETFIDNLPESDSIAESFSKEFCWYLALNPNKKLSINNISITSPENTLTTEIIDVNNHTFTIDIIRWHEKLTSERSFVYLLSSNGRVVHKQLSTFNHKPNFHTSIFLKSNWADSFKGEKKDLITEQDNTLESDIWKKALKTAFEITERVYKEFLIKFIDSELSSYEENGIFPTYNGIEKPYAEWRLGYTKKIIRTLYSADPSILQSLNKKQKKIIVRLIDRLAISNENDSLFEIISSVLDLNEESLNNLAGQLKNTHFDHIISTIETIQQRLNTVAMLRKLMNDHYKEVLETPDLQKIIEANTWLFGHQYETLGAEEDTFTKIAKSLKEKVKGISELDENDFDPAEFIQIEGAQRQTDLFLARKRPHFDDSGRQIFKCTIIEIKRPSISLNVKHLRQLDDYAAIISKHPEFSSESIHFDLILVGRKISNEDIEIPSRLNAHRGKGRLGLVTDDPKVKRYVLNWYTLLDDLELAQQYLLDKLQIKRNTFEEESKDKILNTLQSSAA